MSEAPTRHLGDVASFVRGITFKPGDVVPVGSPGSVACMRTKNVQSKLDLSDVWGIPKSFVKRADQYLLTEDLLVSSANSWNLVGKCCRVPQLQWPATFGGFISVLRGDPSQIEARYLYHWFSSPRIQATVRSFGQQTTNISNLNVDRCLHLWLPPPVPPRTATDCCDPGQGGRATDQAPHRSRPTRHPHPIHLPRHVRRPCHESEGMAGGDHCGHVRSKGRQKSSEG